VAEILWVVWRSSFETRGHPLIDAEGLKRETTLDQAVQRGELTRGVTVPAIAIAASPSAIGVAGTAAAGAPAVEKLGDTHLSQKSEPEPEPKPEQKL